MSFNCLIVDEMHPSLAKSLQDYGIGVSYRPKINREEIISVLPDFQGLVIRSKTIVDKQLIGNSKLKFVARAGAGIDNLDTDFLNEKGIAILNAPEGNRDAVGDHTLGLILNLFNNIVKSNNEVKKGIWDREGNRGTELNSKVVGLIGFGNTGRAVAKRLKPFGCEIIAYDKYNGNFDVDFVREVNLSEIQKYADLISFHVPLTIETHNQFNLDFINKMEKPFYVINTSRGEILSNEDLITGLTEGKILGAGLDVLENEKIERLPPLQKTHFQKLVNFNNVLITPHIAGWTLESYKRINEVLFEKIIAAFDV